MRRFPALHDANETEPTPLPEASEEWIVGRGRESVIAIRDASCSRRQFALAHRKGRYLIEPLSESVPTLLNGKEVKGSVEIKHQDRIEFGDTRLIFLTQDDEAETGVGMVGRSVSAPPTGGAETVFHGSGPVRPLAVNLEIPITQSSTLGRDKGPGFIQLDHPSVSRRHASLKLEGGRCTLEDLHSTNGTFVNGNRLTGPKVLERGDRIEIGPFRLEFTGSGFRSSSLDGNVRLVARSLGRSVPHRSGSGMVKLIDGITLVLRPRRFVCILGPSGSGKSTLMNALSARVPADEGNVYVNGDDLYAGFESFKTQIALVPQKDVLHEVLTVEEALDYTARLRLPRDSAETDIRSAVRAAMEAARIESKANERIANLSGGQVKRASLANEIICRPNLLFLDEMTSGLDEQTDREMMSLFREMAEGGKTVICITHTLAHVAEFCHEVVILTPGGLLAFHGSPPEALAYFGVERLGDVYQLLANTEPSSWRDRYEAWRKKGSEYALGPEDDALSTVLPDSTKQSTPDRVLEARRQFSILLRRVIHLAIGDRRNLGFAALQCGIVGILVGAMAAGFKPSDISQKLGEFSPDVAAQVQQAFVAWKRTGHDAMVLFLMGVTCLWFGANNASKEIVKERTIYERERDVNLSIAAYIASKAVVLWVMGILQATVVWLCARIGGFPGTDAPVFLQMVLVIIAGTNLGLWVSAVSKTRDQSATLVPLVLIPQIVLSGAVQKLAGVSDVIAKTFVTAHWNYAGTVGGMTEDQLRLLDRDLPDPWTAISMQVLHVLLFFAFAWSALVSKDARSKAVYGAAVRSWVNTARRRIEDISKRSPMRR